MENSNQTQVTEFILDGLSRDRRTQLFLFVLFLLMYVITVFGNTALIGTVIASPKMHTPMYYFLCHLSFLDLFYSLSIIPKMLLDMVSVEGGRISLIGCMIQMCTCLFLGQTECILLAVMAYDRYIAICFPLRYTVIMSWKLCKNITVIVWLGSFLQTSLPIISQPPNFCHEKHINHFVCEILAVLKLACGNIHLFEKMIFFGSLFTLLVPFVFISGTYICIILSVLKIQSVDGRNKAFSTCASHLTVVCMFYGTSMTMYLGPIKNASEKHKYVTIIYGTITPMLNPLIYSLRNNEVKKYLKKLLPE
ncbi:olfactory receptor 2A7-like [Pelobates fuscus]|uniref:olfactory receptor 2A7-like n=1 Tax=Pelobates fuscus TaxID=191477 RepID=UPI002FE4E449